METIRATMLPPLLSCFFSILLLSQSQLTTATAAAVETVKVSTTPIFPEIPLGQARKDFQVLLRVEAPAAAAAHRAPIDVVAVLDVSGSMNDAAATTPPPPEKRRLSRLDVLKAAAKFMVDKLHDGDRLSVVAFNDRPVKELSSGGLLYMSGDGRRNAVNVVDKLEARGGTALLPALEEAVKILDGRPVDGKKIPCRSPANPTSCRTVPIGDAWTEEKIGREDVVARSAWLRTRFFFRSLRLDSTQAMTRLTGAPSTSTSLRKTLIFERLLRPATLTRRRNTLSPSDNAAAMNARRRRLRGRGNRHGRRMRRRTESGDNRRRD